MRILEAVSSEEKSPEADKSSVGLGGVTRKLDGAGCTGDIGGGTMGTRETCDVHGQDKTKVDAWASTTNVLTPTLTCVIPIHPCLIAVVRSYVRKVQWHVKVGKSLCGKCLMGNVPCCDFHVGVCVIHLCVDTLESEWQEVGVGIDLQGGISRESEICRRSGKTGWY